MRRSLAFPAFLALPALFLARPARAQEGEPGAQAGLAIKWQGPDDCQRGEAVQAKVLRMLGASKRVLGERFEVQVTVERDAPDRYVALLATTTQGGGGTKRLEGESCDAIALASSVVIALSIDPEASLDAQEPEPEKAPAPQPPAREPRRPKRPPLPESREPRATSPYLHGSVGVLFGLLRDPAAFSALAVGVRHHLVSAELGGALYQSRDVFHPARPRAGAELRLYSADLLGCYAPLRSQLGSLAACLGGRLEHLTATGFGVSNPDHGTVLILAGLAAVRGRLLATSWLAATLDAGISARPFHPTFVLLGVGNVFDIPVVSPFGRTGLMVEF